jgi:hypothetical protein
LRAGFDGVAHERFALVARRNKLMAAFEEQGRVLEAALAVRPYMATVPPAKKAADGSAVNVETEKAGFLRV